DVAQQLLAADDFVAMREEVAQQLELARRQRDAAPLAKDQPLLQPDDDIAERKLLAAHRVPVVTANLRAHPGQQLVHAEGFADVIIGAEIQALDAIALVGARGEQDDRHARALGAQRPAHLEAADAGQHDVQQQQREGLVGERAKALLAGRYRGDLIAVELEVVGEHRSQLWFVLDDQHAAQIIRGGNFSIHETASRDSTGRGDAAITGGFASGSKMRNVLPAPGTLVMSTRPPWAWTRSRPIGRARRDPP